MDQRIAYGLWLVATKSRTRSATAPIVPGSWFFEVSFSSRSDDPLHSMFLAVSLHGMNSAIPLRGKI